MLDIPYAKRSKASTSINTSGLYQTKENVLKGIANWLSLMNHNYAIDNATPPLLYDAFLNLLISLMRKITRVGMAAPFEMRHGFLCSTLISCSRSCQVSASLPIPLP
eukprot:13681998-Ditylum_brightwellii.AAC.1